VRTGPARRRGAQQSRASAAAGSVGRQRARAAPLVFPLTHSFYFSRATQNYLRPSLERQRNASNTLYYKAKQERVKLVEELVLQKKFWPWGQ
jgi:hypothetical protein